jgi:hypothetical protein
MNNYNEALKCYDHILTINKNDWYALMEDKHLKDMLVKFKR